MTRGIRIICIIAVLMTGACSIRKNAIGGISGIAETGIAAFEQDDNLDLVVKAMPANIKLFEVLLESDPKNEKLLILLSRLYGSYGFAAYETPLEALLLEVEMPSDSIYRIHPDADRLKTGLEQIYRKGAEYALRSLSLRHAEAPASLNNITAADDFFKSLSEKDVQALFWYGFNLGSYVNLNRNSVKALSQMHLVEKAMHRVIELDPDYFHGGAHLVLLMYYASRPVMMGGNPEAAKRHYEALKETAGDDFLPADVFFARYYLHQMQQRQSFEETLTRVLQKPAGGKTTALMNRVARDRAEIYLRAIDDLFP